MSPLIITLIILGLTMVAFVTGKFSFPVISMSIILSLILTNVLTPAEAFSGFVNTNVVMVAAMFVVGAGLTKTNLLDKIQSLVVKYKDNHSLTIFIGCLASAVLAIITSGPAAMAIMIPLLVAIASETGISRSKLLFPGAALANIAVGMTFLGQGAANLTWNEVMLNAGGQIPFTIWSFTIARLPLVIIGLVYMVFFGHKLLPNRSNEQFTDHFQKKDTSSKLSPVKEKIAIAIIVLTILAIIFANQINVKMYISACIGAILLVLFGIMKDAEALSSIHLPTIFLFAGVLPLSDALKITGAGDVVAEGIIKILGNTTNPYVIMTVFFLIPLVITQVMSNTACIAIFVPLVASAAVKIGVDPRAAVMGVVLASCTSILTPMASPTQTIVMEPGGYTIRDYFKCGVPLVFILTIVSIFWLPLIFPFY